MSRSFECLKKAPLDRRESLLNILLDDPLYLAGQSAGLCAVLFIRWRDLRSLQMA